MIKFLGSKNGRPMIGLGLSRENCRKLLDGKPIFIDLKVMMMDVKELPNLNEATILIFGGKDEATMQKDLVKHGAKLPSRVHPHSEEN